MKIFLIVISILFSFSNLIGQNNVFEVFYNKVVKNKPDTLSAISFKFCNNIAYLSKKTDKVQSYIDYNQHFIADVIVYDKHQYKTIQSFDSLPKATPVSSDIVILGHKCKKAVYTYFSNKIEVWFTSETVVKGSPYKKFLPQNGLVLKIVVNGGAPIVAQKIKHYNSDSIFDYTVNSAKLITQSEYRDIQIKSRYVTVNVFDNEKVNFGGKIVNPEFGKLNITYRFAKGTILLRKIKLPSISKKGATVFAKLSARSNGDAYDRTASLFTFSNSSKNSMINAFINGIKTLPVINDNKGNRFQGFVSDSSYDAPIELMRFFTSFGVSHFNNLRKINNYNWVDSVVYKEDITSLISNTDDEIWIGVYIGNYDKGGHKISLELDFYPPWEVDTSKKWIAPIFNTVTILEADGQNYSRLFNNDTLEAVFEIPDSVENLNLVYTTTGHGGWENGDEFQPKLNKILIDNKLLFSIVPWRTDCACYRLMNPASGNFANGLSSSDLSRSNWCPGTVTYPYIIPLNNLSKGKHRIKVVINQGKDEGNSFSHWQVSGTITGNVVE